MINSDDHYRILEKIYLDAPINKLFQPTIIVSKGGAVITIEVKKELYHAAHALHGSVYFKMLDDASYFAANSIEPNVFLLTTQFNIYLLRPVSEGKITSKGKLHFSSSTLFIAEATLLNEEGKELACGRGTFVKSKIPLSTA